jgi:hypothetical protein
VNSDYPSAQERRAQAGALALEAGSHQTDSRSSVTDGVNRSDVRVAAGADDTVTATAETVLGYVSLGKLLAIDGLRSTARATLAPGGALERASDLSVGALVIAGQRVAVTPEQLAQIGDATSGLKAALDQLAAQGVHLSYLKPADSQDGVTSAALQVSWTAPVPNYGTATITVLLGRTFVHVSNQPLEASAVPSLGDVVPPPSSSASHDNGSPASPTTTAAGADSGSPAGSGGPASFGSPDGLSSGSDGSASFAGGDGLSGPPGLVGPSGPVSTSASAHAAAALPSGGAGGPPRSATTRLVATPAALADKTPVSRLAPVLALSALALLTTVGLYRRYGVISR